jgi:FMN phosphatase YigB (HAD superfamily)/DNA-binding XRE family transcriptional regulator
MGGENAEERLGKRLQLARQKAGMTQQQLCQKASLSYSTLAKIERGAIKAPSIFTIQSIAAALGLSLDNLMGIASALTVVPKKRSKSGVRFVYFDINGCLVRFFHRAFIRLSDDSGTPADMVETTFWHYNDAVCRGEMSITEFNALFAEKLGLDTLDWLSYYLEAVDAIPEMQEVVRWASENYYVGLLSNIMPGFIDAMLSKQILPNIPYTAIIDSSQVGAIKPEQQIYEIAAQRTGVASEEILLIDDSRSNLMAAEKMGWHVQWFDDYRPEESADRVRATLEPEN